MKSSWSHPPSRVNKQEIAVKIAVPEADLHWVKDPYDLASSAIGTVAKLAQLEAEKKLNFIYPKSIETSSDSSGTVNVDVRFVTNYPQVKDTEPMPSIDYMGRKTFYVQAPLSPVAQRVYLKEYEAEKVILGLGPYTGGPLTTDNILLVQQAAESVVTRTWERQYRNEYLCQWPDDTSTSATPTLGTAAFGHLYSSPSDNARISFGVKEDKKRKYRNKLKKNYIEPVRMQNHRGTMSVRSTRGGAQFNNVSPQEIVALQLLRNMVSKDAFRNYLRRGIVSVTGPSGLVYAIERKNHLVEVYRKGKLLSTLCVYLKDTNMPPTDEVVAKMVIVQCDEHDIWRRANINWKGVPADMRTTVNRHNFKEEHLVQLAVA